MNILVPLFNGIPAPCTKTKAPELELEIVTVLAGARQLELDAIIAQLPAVGRD